MYASRARPGPPENEMKMTASPMRIHGARKPTISMRAGILPRRTGGGLVGLELAAHPGEGVADQPRHVHLGDPDPLGDVRLRQALEEAQVQDGPLARGQPLDAAGEGDPLLGLLERPVVLTERLHRAAALLVGVRAL